MFAQQAFFEQSGRPVFPAERPWSVPEVIQMPAGGTVVQGQPIPALGRVLYNKLAPPQITDKAWCLYRSWAQVTAFSFLSSLWPWKHENSSEGW